MSKNPFPGLSEEVADEIFSASTKYDVAKKFMEETDIRLFIQDEIHSKMLTDLKGDREKYIQWAQDIETIHKKYEELTQKYQLIFNFARTQDEETVKDTLELFNVAYDYFDYLMTGEIKKEE